ncbi:LysM peptidoglycan-binding domain-containing protein [Kitasatospora sp. A2-31]|nr:LysM peptidoglycan-binding domain-containing protein [Kitasatospora sp. A2-31]
MAENLAARRGLAPWPACGAHAAHGSDTPAAHAGPRTGAHRPAQPRGHAPTGRTASTDRTDGHAGAHAAAAPSAVEDVPDADRPGTWTVRAGDTLDAIAQASGTPGGWPALHALNDETIGPDPDLLLPGQVLVLT